MRNLLATLWNEPRAPGAPGPIWRDWVLVVFTIIISVVDGALNAQLWPAIAVALSIGIAFTLPWRRVLPIQMAAVAFGAIFVVQIIAHFQGVDWNSLDSNVIYYLVFSYALSRWGSGREIGVGLTVVALSFLTTLSVELKSWLEVLGTIGFFLLPALAGGLVRYQDSAQRRATEQLRSQERERLARELHDTVAHHVSAIAIQAQAGQALAATQPDAPKEILATIEEAASRTLSEMRHIVQALRDDTRTVQPPTATLADIKRLAADDSSPLRVDVSLTGELDNLDTTVETTLFRLVQEALTNASRHARDAKNVVVQVTGEPEQVRLRVVDDGREVARQPVAGLGLRGMAERVALLGGTLHTAPGATRGWVVQASLPKKGVA